MALGSLRTLDLILLDLADWLLNLLLRKRLQLNHVRPSLIPSRNLTLLASSHVFHINFSLYL